MKLKNDTDSGTRKAGFAQGAAAAWPICLGYMPIGLAFGVLAQKAGLLPLEIGLMSVIVFAGSSQFIAVSMLAAGASIFSIVATTFMVNLRHFLMSSALAVYMKNADRKKLSFFAYGVTDESFAVNLSKFRDSAWDLDSALGHRRSIYPRACLWYRLCPDCHVHLSAGISNQGIYLRHHCNNCRIICGFPVAFNTGKFLYRDRLHDGSCRRCGYKEESRLWRETLAWCQQNIWQL